MDAPPRPAGNARRGRNAPLHQVGIIPLLFLTYAYTTGGPFGYERMFSLSGPGMALLFLLAVPLLYSIPMSLAAAEMNSILPVQGGFYRWVRAAFGNFWGFQAGWWNWTGTFLMNSAYGVQFMDYLGQFLGTEFPPLAKWLGASVFLWLIAWANIRGIEVAGWIAVALQLIIFLPVTWLCLAAASQWQHNPLVPLVPEGAPFTAALGAGLALAVWLYSGYEQLSSVSEEIRDSTRTLTRVLAWMTPLAILTYALPTLLALAALGNWRDWNTGYLASAATSIGGPVLGAALLAASVVGTASLSNSTVLSTSRVPFAMAEDGYLPRWLAEIHPKFRTPTRAIVMATILCCALAITNVVELITVYIWTRIASSILTLLATWGLRVKLPDATRRFRIPGGATGMVYTVVVPIVFFAACLYYSDPVALRYGPWLLATGPLAFWVLRLVRGPVRQEIADRAPTSEASR
jgi:amino acid transporter